jgi:hypothetical protein
MGVGRGVNDLTPEKFTVTKLTETRMTERVTMEEARTHTGF